MVQVRPPRWLDRAAPPFPSLDMEEPDEEPDEQSGGRSCSRGE